MKAPFSWLKEYVDIDCTPEELQTKLFSCGFEVEEMKYVASHINKIVVCKIVNITKHPNADKLSVCLVDAGKYGRLQIVTNATNIYEGAVVPVALDGSTLNDGSKINAGVLRGINSDGMFCSGEELGITDDWYEGASVNGILILDSNFTLGEEVKKLLDLEDVMFDINITANRPDCQSILGLAREIAAVLDKPLKEPSLDYVVDKSVSTVKSIKVSNKAFDLCPRYISHYVKDVVLSESPLWMKRRLFRMGVRSINNIVDITNYVLLEIGQPMHAFDLSNLEGNEIVVRRADANEKITTLDEKEFELSNNNLVICDAVKPVALAGVMGGLNSEIKETTKNIVFESAKFARDNIRKTSRSLGQRTDASSRYEKGVDAYSTEIGMKRALSLISMLKCGKIAYDQYDLFESKTENKVIETKISKVNAVLGICIPDSEIQNILERLNFGVKISGDDLSVTVPLYREDVEDYPDIAEELIREYGYDHIESTLLKTSQITNGGKNSEQSYVDNLKNLLIGYGFNEIITYSFVSEKEYDVFGFDKTADEHRFIRIMNPLGEDLAVMRTTLLPSMVRTVSFNLNRKNSEGRLFEFAKVYNPQELPLSKLPVENERLSFAAFGENEDFFTVKGVVEGIISNFAFGASVKYVPCKLKCLHPTRSAYVYINGVLTGYFGQVNPCVCDKFDIDKPIYAGEFFYNELKNFFNGKIVCKPVSKFPTVERDIAVSIADDVSCDKIIETIKRNAGEYIDEVKLFDVYKGNQVENGKKSMAFNLKFVSNERTLSVEEVDDSIKRILKSLRDELGGELR